MKEPPECCPLCSKRRHDVALVSHLRDTHSARMVLLESRTDKQYWPPEEPSRPTNPPQAMRRDGPKCCPVCSISVNKLRRLELWHRREKGDGQDVDRDIKLAMHLWGRHSARMVLLESETGEQFWPPPEEEAEVIRK